MTVDDIVKLVLVFSLAFAVVGIAYQIMRLIGKLADSIQDLRKAVQNVSAASDMALEDYQQLRKLLHSLMDIISNFEENILMPVRTVTKLVQRFSGNGGDTQSDDKDI